MRRMQVGPVDTAGLHSDAAVAGPAHGSFQRWWLKWRVRQQTERGSLRCLNQPALSVACVQVFILAIAIPRLLSPNFGHRLATQFDVEVLGASRTNLGMLDSARHWMGLFSNPFAGWLARTRGIKWLLALHNIWLSECGTRAVQRLSLPLLSLPPTCCGLLYIPVISNLWTANMYDWHQEMYSR